MNISYSRVSSYLRCPYAHYLSYVEKLMLNRPIRPLRFGSDFHKLLELRNRPEELAEAKIEIGDTFYSLPPAWQSDLGDDYIQNLEVIFQDYCQVWKDSKSPQVTEKRFDLPIGKAGLEDIVFTGVIDELYLSKEKSTGKKSIRIGEHKTFSVRPTMNTLAMNAQGCLYSKAAEIIYGVKPSHILWDYVKSTPAKEPMWLEKTNRFSTAKSDSITPHSWERACAARGLEEPVPEQYQHNTQNFFFRVELDVMPNAVEDIWQGFVRTATEIAVCGHENTTKNVTRDCGWCSFRDICFSQFTGGDTEYLIQTNYTKREPAEKKEVTE